MWSGVTAEVAALACAHGRFGVPLPDVVAFLAGEHINNTSNSSSSSNARWPICSAPQYFAQRGPDACFHPARDAVYAAGARFDAHCAALGLSRGSSALRLAVGEALSSGAAPAMQWISLVHLPSNKAVGERAAAVRTFEGAIFPQLEQLRSSSSSSKSSSVFRLPKTSKSKTDNPLLGAFGQESSGTDEDDDGFAALSSSEQLTLPDAPFDTLPALRGFSLFAIGGRVVDVNSEREEDVALLQNVIAAACNNSYHHAGVASSAGASSSSASSKHAEEQCRDDPANYFVLCTPYALGALFGARGEGFDFVVAAGRVGISRAALSAILGNQRMYQAMTAWRDVCVHRKVLPLSAMSRSTTAAAASSAHKKRAAAAVTVVAMSSSSQSPNKKENNEKDDGAGASNNDAGDEKKQQTSVVTANSKAALPASTTGKRFREALHLRDHPFTRIFVSACDPLCLVEPPDRQRQAQQQHGDDLADDNKSAAAASWPPRQQRDFSRGGRYADMTLSLPALALRDMLPFLAPASVVRACSVLFVAAADQSSKPVPLLRLFSSALPRQYEAAVLGSDGGGGSSGSATQLGVAPNKLKFMLSWTLALAQLGFHLHVETRGGIVGHSALLSYTSLTSIVVLLPRAVKAVLGLSRDNNSNANNAVPDNQPPQLSDAAAASLEQQRRRAIDRLIMLPSDDDADDAEAPASTALHDRTTKDGDEDGDAAARASAAAAAAEAAAAVQQQWLSDFDPLSAVARFKDRFQLASVRQAVDAAAAAAVAAKNKSNASTTTTAGGGGDAPSGRGLQAHMLRQLQMELNQSDDAAVAAGGGDDDNDVAGARRASSVCSVARSDRTTATSVSFLMGSASGIMAKNDTNANLTTETKFVHRPHFLSLYGLDGGRGEAAAAAAVAAASSGDTSLPFARPASSGGRALPPPLPLFGGLAPPVHVLRRPLAFAPPAGNANCDAHLFQQIDDLVFRQRFAICVSDCVAAHVCDPEDFCHRWAAPRLASGVLMQLGVPDGKNARIVFAAKPLSAVAPKTASAAEAAAAASVARALQSLTMRESVRHIYRYTVAAAIVYMLAAPGNDSGLAVSGSLLHLASMDWKMARGLVAEIEQYRAERDKAARAKQQPNASNAAPSPAHPLSYLDPFLDQYRCFRVSLMRNSRSTVLFALSRRYKTEEDVAEAVRAAHAQLAMLRRSRGAAAAATASTQQQQAFAVNVRADGLFGGDEDDAENDDDDEDEEDNASDSSAARGADDDAMQDAETFAAQRNSKKSLAQSKKQQRSSRQQLEQQQEQQQRRQKAPVAKLSGAQRYLDKNRALLCAGALKNLLPAQGRLSFAAQPLYSADWDWRDIGCVFPVLLAVWNIAAAQAVSSAAAESKQDGATASDSSSAPSPRFTAVTLSTSTALPQLPFSVACGLGIVDTEDIVDQVVSADDFEAPLKQLRPAVRNALFPTPADKEALMRSFIAALQLLSLVGFLDFVDAPEQQQQQQQPQPQPQDFYFQLRTRIQLKEDNNNNNNINNNAPSNACEGAAAAAAASTSTDPNQSKAPIAVIDASPSVLCDGTALFLQVAAACERVQCHLDHQNYGSTAVLAAGVRSSGLGRRRRPGIVNSTDSALDVLVFQHERDAPSAALVGALTTVATGPLRLVEEQTVDALMNDVLRGHRCPPTSMLRQLGDTFAALEDSSSSASSSSSSSSSVAGSDNNDDDEQHVGDDVAAPRSKKQKEKGDGERKKHRKPRNKKFGHSADPSKFLRYVLLDRPLLQFRRFLAAQEQHAAELRTRAEEEREFALIDSSASGGGATALAAASQVAANAPAGGNVVALSKYPHAKFVADADDGDGFAMGPSPAGNNSNADDTAATTAAGLAFASVNESSLDFTQQAQLPIRPPSVASDLVGLLRDADTRHQLGKGSKQMIVDDPDVVQRSTLVNRPLRKPPQPKKTAPAAEKKRATATPSRARDETDQASAGAGRVSDIDDDEELGEADGGFDEDHDDGDYDEDLVSDDDGGADGSSNVSNFVDGRRGHKPRITRRPRTRVAQTLEQHLLSLKMRGTHGGFQGGGMRYQVANEMRVAVGLSRQQLLDAFDPAAPAPKSDGSDSAGATTAAAATAPPPVVDSRLQAKLDTYKRAVRSMVQLETAPNLSAAATAISAADSSAETAAATWTFALNNGNGDERDVDNDANENDQTQPQQQQQQQMAVKGADDAVMHDACAKLLSVMCCEHYDRRAAALLLETIPGGADAQIRALRSLVDRGAAVRVEGNRADFRLRNHRPSHHFTFMHSAPSAAIDGLRVVGGEHGPPSSVAGAAVDGTLGGRGSDWQVRVAAIRSEICQLLDDHAAASAVVDLTTKAAQHATVGEVLAAATAQMTLQSLMLRPQQHRATAPAMQLFPSGPLEPFAERSSSSSQHGSAATRGGDAAAVVDSLSVAEETIRGRAVIALSRRLMISSAMGVACRALPATTAALEASDTVAGAASTAANASATIDDAVRETAALSAAECRRQVSGHKPKPGTDHYLISSAVIRQLNSVFERIACRNASKSSPAAAVNGQQEQQHVQEGQRYGVLWNMDGSANRTTVAMLLCSLYDFLLEFPLSSRGAILSAFNRSPQMVTDGEIDAALAALVEMGVVERRQNQQLHRHAVVVGGGVTATAKRRRQRDEQPAAVGAEDEGQQRAADAAVHSSSNGGDGSQNVVVLFSAVGPVMNVMRATQ